MTDPQALVAPTLTGLADLLEATSSWQASTLCEGWEVRHLVAHVTMPARMTPEQFGAEMAAVAGDFTALSNKVAARDGELPPAELLAQLRSPALHAWQPPAGGAAGALSHAVIHSLDATVALGVEPVAPQEARLAVLDQLVGAGGAFFGVDLSGTRLVATDADWASGAGDEVAGTTGELVALVAARTLPAGRSLPRA